MFKKVQKVKMFQVGLKRYKRVLEMLRRLIKVDKISKKNGEGARSFQKVPGV